MLSSDNNIETIAQLVEELRRFFALKGEYYRLDFTEKVVRVVTAIVVTFVLVLLSFFILGLLSLTIAFVLEPLMGRIGAFAFVTGLYLLLFVLCLLFRKKWFERPLVRFFASLIMD
ncbi:MAG: phage holin family protein [Prevotella sp.]|nr:phage holin family protein [Prevotella sp.]